MQEKNQRFLLRQQQELTEQQQVHWESLPLVDVVTKLFLKCQKALRDANVALHKDKEEMLAQLQTGQSEVMSILFFSQISLLWTTITACHRAIKTHSAFTKVARLNAALDAKSQKLLPQERVGGVFRMRSTSVRNQFMRTRRGKMKR